MRNYHSIAIAYGALMLFFAYVLESEKYILAIGFGMIAGLLGIINEKLHEMNKILREK
jgi:hypothetical protein